MRPAISQRWFRESRGKLRSMMLTRPTSCGRGFRLPRSFAREGKRRNQNEHSRYTAITGHIMAASITINRPPTPLEIAQATAKAMPFGISTRPLLGIIGVLIGAHLVTLAGRMLSLGLADLKGHLGISYDEGAWLDSAFNAAIM